MNDSDKRVICYHVHVGIFSLALVVIFFLQIYFMLDLKELIFMLQYFLKPSVENGH